MNDCPDPLQTSHCDVDGDCPLRQASSLNALRLRLPVIPCDQHRSGIGTAVTLATASSTSGLGHLDLDSQPKAVQCRCLRTLSLLSRHSACRRVPISDPCPFNRFSSLLPTNSLSHRIQAGGWRRLSRVYGEHVRKSYTQFEAPPVGTRTSIKRQQTAFNARLRLLRCHRDQVPLATMGIPH